MEIFCHRVIFTALMLPYMLGCNDIGIPSIKSCKPCGERKWLIESEGGCIGRLYDFPFGLFTGLIEGLSMKRSRLISCSRADSDRYEYGYGLDRSLGGAVAIASNGHMYVAAGYYNRFSFKGITRKNSEWSNIILQWKGCRSDTDIG